MAKQLTLKEELEIIRDGRVQGLTGDPMDIPCIETSDSERLCKHPVVSVHMVTYNHEPYIRQAIDGVLMQKTDFDFELVIGEDCSTDKTREICFEYQKRYPDKIRVLWWHKNSYQFPHPAGGNWERNIAHCRGEFVAFCEGDDYWTDPYKLQKQIDLIRAKNADMCVAFTEFKWSDGRTRVNVCKERGYITIQDLTHDYFHTTTFLIRRDKMLLVQKRYPKLCNWYEITWLFCIASVGKICLLPEIVSVYRKTSTGMSTSLKAGEFAKFVAKQNFELYMHGPEEAKDHFMQLTQKKVDIQFKSSRSYRPSEFLVKNWRGMIAAHLMLLKIAKSFSMKKEIDYGLNVGWFAVRQLLVLAGLGVLLKPLPNS